MCNMGSGNTRRGLLVAMCAAVTVFSLAAHFIADAACRSPEFSTTRSCHSARNAASAEAPLTASSLHASVATPAVTLIVSPIVLAFAVVSVRLFTLTRFVSPPVQPPKALSIM